MEFTEISDNSGPCERNSYGIKGLGAPTLVTIGTLGSIGVRSPKRAAGTPLRAVGRGLRALGVAPDEAATLAAEAVAAAAAAAETPAS